MGYNASDQFDLSFRRTEDWTAMDLGAGGPVHATNILIGDDVSGPVLTLWAVEPNQQGPAGGAHSHASDSWRISLRGTVPVGPKSYTEGQFRLQEGWKPYGADNFASGPDGGWLIVTFADRRGMRVRPVKKDEEGAAEANKGLAAWLGVGDCDLVSDDPKHEPGPSALATSLGDAGKAAHLDGSFADADSWRSTGVGNRVSAALLGEREVGSFMLFVATEPGAVSSPSCVFDTDVLRIVAGGSGRVGSAEIETGDVRSQPKGDRCEEVVAGPNGLHEIIVFADRRSVTPIIAKQGGWLVGLSDVVAELSGKLLATAG
jgi:hypothetical protein